MVVSQNINGVGYRSKKLVKLYETVKKTLGHYPDVILIQEARQTIFKSHVPGYNVYSRFAAEFGDV